LDKASESANGFPEPSTAIVAVLTGPSNSEIKGSKPPAGIAWLAAFVPPPKPHVWKVTVSFAVSVKVVSKALSGEPRVPVYERLSAERLTVPAVSKHSSAITFLIKNFSSS
jgi:hypothetical protein